jgi:hypothetical protein
MAPVKTILVVGLISEDEAPTTFLRQEAFADFEEQTVYEVVIRLTTGKPLPDRLMTTVSTPDELQQLIQAVEGRGIRLAVMTDERGRPQPQSVEDLLTQLASHRPGGDTPDLFPIL